MAGMGTGRTTCAAAALIAVSTLSIAGCTGSGSPGEDLAELSKSVKFDTKTYGVPASPRVTESVDVEKGGGRSQVGKPYKVRGKWYYPKDDPGYVATGKASWYGPNFHGRLTANGEVYDMHGLSAAHKTFPLPSYAMVTNRENGRQIMVRVNDRGPFSNNREIDLSAKAASILGFKKAGTATVEVDYVGRAPLEGDDTAMLMASYQGGGSPGSSATTPTGSMLAIAGVPASVPVPVSRGYVAAYTAQEAPATAAGAVAALHTLATNGPETIALGLISRETMDRVRAVLPETARLSIDDAAEGRPLTGSVTVAEDGATDALLRRVRGMGATEAFVVHD